MTQSRIYDFGATLTQGKTKTHSSVLFTPGVYEGFQPTVVSASEIQFSAGSFLLPNGVLVSESDPVIVAFATPGVATDYTITAEHGDIQAIGGSAVTYVLNTGILPRSGSPNTASLAVAWIRHPGAIALDQSMVSAPETPKMAAPSETLVPAPFPASFDEILGANVTMDSASHSSGPQTLGLAVSNSAAVGLQTAEFRIGVPSGILPRSIRVFADIPALGSISVTTGTYTPYLSDGTVLSVTGSPIAGPASGLDPTGSPAGTFTLGTYDASTPLVSLGFTITIPPSDNVFIRAIEFVED